LSQKISLIKSRYKVENSNDFTPLILFDDKIKIVSENWYNDKSLISLSGVSFRTAIVLIGQRLSFFNFPVGKYNYNWLIFV
jgi:hypothetical protein